MGYSASGIFYFSVGVAIQRFRLKLASQRVAIACGVIGFALLAVKLLSAFNTWRCEILLGKLSLPFLIYFTWHFMTAKKLPDWLTACSFPIFLMHTMLFKYFDIVLKHLPIAGLASDFVVYFGGVIGAIIITSTLRRIKPNVAMILFGGR